MVVKSISERHAHVNDARNHHEYLYKEFWGVCPEKIYGNKIKNLDQNLFGNSKALHVAAEETPLPLGIKTMF